MTTPTTEPVTAPPVAQRTICVDFDGTVIPFGAIDSSRPPFTGVPAALAAAREAGFRVVIWTSRLSPTWWADDFEAYGFESAEAFGEDQASYVAAVLEEHGIEYDLVTAEKVPALAYFDDRAVRVHDHYRLPAAIADFIAGAYR